MQPNESAAQCYGIFQRDNKRKKNRDMPEEELGVLRGHAKADVKEAMHRGLDPLQGQWGNYPQAIQDQMWDIIDEVREEAGYKNPTPDMLHPDGSLKVEHMNPHPLYGHVDQQTIDRREGRLVDENSSSSPKGNCPTPNNLDVRGNKCGGRAASVRGATSGYESKQKLADPDPPYTKEGMRGMRKAAAAAARYQLEVLQGKHGRKLQKQAKKENYRASIGK